MHRITISSDPCGKPSSAKCGVQELEVDNIVLMTKARKRRLGNAFWFEFPGFWKKKLRVRVRTLSSLYLIRILLVVFYFSLSLHFTPGLQSAVCILPSICILPPVCSLQSDRFPFGIAWARFSSFYRTDVDNRSPISLVKYKFVVYQGSSLAAASSLLKLPNNVTYFPLLHNGSAAFESLHVVPIGIIDSIGRIFLPDRQTRNVLKITISHFGYFRLGNQSIFDRLYRRNKFHKVKCKTNFKNTYVLSELSNRRLVTQPRQHRSLNWSSN